MDEKQLKALIRKTTAKVERAKAKPRPAYDATLDATRTTPEETAPPRARRRAGRRGADLQGNEAA